MGVKKANKSTHVLRPNRKLSRSDHSNPTLRWTVSPFKGSVWSMDQLVNPRHSRDWHDEGVGCRTRPHSDF